MTNHVVPLETFQSLNEVKNPICASNDYHSFRYCPLLAGNNSALSAPCAIQYIIYCSCFYDREDRRTITEGERYFSAGSLAPIFFTFWVFFKGNWNISSGRNRCNKSEIAVECPLNVDWIEIQGIPMELAVRVTFERLLWVENFIRKD